jgi:VWFA-related protein
MQDVLLDMVVRDKRGQPVLDLRQDEIQVSEDGTRCDVVSVRLVQAGTVKAASRGLAGPAATPENPPPVGAATPGRLSLVVLVFDRLSGEPARVAREAATQFVSKAFPPDTWFAAAKVGPGARLLQTLTSNPADLTSAILAATGAADTARDASLQTEPDSRTAQGLGSRSVAGGHAPMSALLKVTQGFAGVFDPRRPLPGHPSLVPLRGIVQSLEPVEGRKTVVYFSEGLRLLTRKTFDALAGDANHATYSSDRTTLDALESDANHANTTIYSLDLIGLAGLSSTDDSRDIPPPSTVPLDTSGLAPSYDQVDASRLALYNNSDPRARSNLNSIDSLKSLAQSTGGFLITNRKQLGRSLDLVASDLASYYEVTYVPQGAEGDGRLRRLQARVLRSGASLRTRRGYFRVPSTPLEPRAAADVDKEPEPENPATDAGTIPAAATSLATILERAGQYVSDYEDTFKNLVAEEEYDQRGKSRGRNAGRLLRSDLVFSSTPGPIPWTCFRDVYEVDGKKVREREARLEKLFLQGTASAIAKAKAIRTESSRYNIGSAVRNVNVPTLALLFLHPRNQGRFRFERKGERWFSGTPGAEVAFTEVVEPSLVNDGHDDLPGEGRFWIDANRGTILRSEAAYRFMPNRALATISVEYRPEPGLNIWVPGEMTERYEDLPGAGWPVFGTTTEGTARYSHYRRFSVSTDEKAEVREP